MTAVPDSSVIVAALVDTGSEGQWCEEVIATAALACPEIALAEVANILRRLEGAGRISPTEAVHAYSNLLKLDLELFPFLPFSERVWTLRGNLTSYDAWYVALAEALDCPLFTLDRRLERAPGPTCDIIVPPTPIRL